MFRGCGGEETFQSLSPNTAAKIVFNATMRDVMAHVPLGAALAPYARMRQKQLEAGKMVIYFPDQDMTISSFDQLETHIADETLSEDGGEEEEVASDCL